MVGYEEILLQVCLKTPSRQSHMVRIYEVSPPVVEVEANGTEGVAEVQHSSTIEPTTFTQGVGRERGFGTVEMIGIGGIGKMGETVPIDEMMTDDQNTTNDNGLVIVGRKIDRQVELDL